MATVGQRLFAAEEIPTREVPEPSAALPAIPPVEEWEQRHEVLRLVASLPVRQQQIMAWTLDGYSPSEIAEVLSMAPDAVRQTLRRARTVLAGQLSPGRRPSLPRAAEEAGHNA
jgi:DNA-directed RNA polymerase specialized sigma24 family protein